MKFRAYVLFSAIFSLLASLPFETRIYMAAGLWLFFALDMAIELWRQRRARIRAAELAKIPHCEDRWRACGATMKQEGIGPDGNGYWIWECANEAGHEGPHQAGGTLEWR